MEYPQERRTIVLETIRMVVEQGRRSTIRPESGCAYRGRDGAKCALGHWIPDELTETPWWGPYDCNTMSVSYLVDSLRLEVPAHPLTLWLSRHSYLIMYLQGLHDYSANWTAPAAMWEAIERFLGEEGISVPDGWGPSWVRKHWKEGMP